NMRNAGFKALAGAGSDINASAGEVRAALLALNIPPSLSLEEFDDFIEGVGECSEKFAIPIVGGNIARGEQFSATVSVVGDCKVLVSRSGACAGDVLCISGATGGSEAGRMLAMAEVVGFEGNREELLGRFFRPEPQFGLGKALAKLGATAMIDISDGLAADTAHIANASGAKISIHLEEVPVFNGVEEAARLAGISPYEIIASSGEEFLLVFAMPPEKLPAAKEICSTIAQIGRVHEGQGVEILLNGKPFPIKKTGWRHF
ncbi:MAG TPA: thiamine-phosphate kinase, partial [candidate division Zixibacteria bacterium]|nr:thiamine-phosphate kinase [candidate division Zixibacteria bacterium]